MEFTTVPAKALVGDDYFWEIQELQREKQICSYQVLRVQGRVMWEGHGSNDLQAKLTLRRERENQAPRCKELLLAKYTHRYSYKKATTVEMDYHPDKDNPFWGTGAKGEFVS